MYAKAKVYLNLTSYVHPVFCSSASIMTLTFNRIIILFFDLQGGELKYAHDCEAEDNNDR